LRRIAAKRLWNEHSGDSLCPTELAHEAWLRLHDAAAVAEDRQHFFAIAASAMRRIMIDRARARKAMKRPMPAASLDQLDIAAPMPPDQVIAVDDALDRLAEINARAARITELRYFAGMTHTEIADLLELDRRTIDRDWAFARAWLFHELSGQAQDPRPPAQQ